MAKTINRLPAYIGYGSSLSTVVDAGDDLVVGLIMPDVWTPARVSVQLSAENVEFRDLFAVDLKTGTSASEVVFNVTPGVVVAVNPNTMLMARYIKLRSGTRDEPINQEATCMFYVITVDTAAAQTRSAEEVTA
jgi:hypothetical protein